jgi:nucleotide-binding universal stress UspA family protein
VTGEARARVQEREEAEVWNFESTGLDANARASSIDPSPLVAATSEGDEMPVARPATATERKEHDATDRNGARGVSRPLRSLLIPIDLTPAADRILARVAHLPLAGEARLTLLHVVPAKWSLAERSDAELVAAESMAEQVRVLRRSLPRCVGVELVVRAGSPANEITDCARDVRADLVVMGRGGRRVLRDALRGSTAECVVRRARVPVLVVRLPAHGTYHRPALAVDLQHPLHRLVGLMLRILPRPRAAIPVVHAFDVPYDGQLLSVDMESSKARWRAKVTRKLKRLLREALTRAKVPSGDEPSWASHARYGCPGVIVDEVTRTNETDLLVVGTRGHSGLDYMLWGTTAGQLLRNVACDVLVVPLPVR